MTGLVKGAPASEIFAAKTQQRMWISLHHLAKQPKGKFHRLKLGRELSGHVCKMQTLAALF